MTEANEPGGREEQDAAAGSDSTPRADSSDATPVTASSAGFGAPLRAAREAQGVSVAEMAARLRLHPRQVGAIEDERLDALPEVAFVRGFLRNYAKEVKLDPVPLLQALAQRAPSADASASSTPNQGATGLVASEVRSAGMEYASRLTVIVGTVVLLAVLAVIGWIASTRSTAPSSASSVTSTSTPAPGAAPAAPVAAPPADTAVASTPAQPAPAPNDAATAAERPGTPATATTPGQPAPVPAATPAAPVAGKEPAASTAATTAATRPPAPAPTSGLRLTFGERPSWVEITDADGQVLLTGLQEAGSERRLPNARPPLRLVIGNASSATVEYRGKTVDLKPHARANDLARLTLD